MTVGKKSWIAPRVAVGRMGGASEMGGGSVSVGEAVAISTVGVGVGETVPVDRGVAEGRRVGWDAGVCVATGTTGAHPVERSRATARRMRERFMACW